MAIKARKSLVLRPSTTITCPVNCVWVEDDLSDGSKQYRPIIVRNLQGVKDVEKHEFTFRVWTYAESLQWRKEATTFDMTRRIHSLNFDHLNRIKIQRLLMSWSFDRGDPMLKLFHVNGIMTDESYAAFTTLWPHLANYVLEEMNRILEYGG